MFGKSAIWVAIGKTVRGASHDKVNLPNQDALRVRSESPWMLVLADGHGSPRCFRSDLGANFAVDVARGEIEGSGHAVIERAQNKGAAYKPSGELEELTEWFVDELPRNIVNAWHRKVDENIATRPFSEEEKKALGLIGDGIERQRLAYGTTLLLVVATERFVFYLQLGDGDILVFDATGNVRRPLVKDERLIANETTSLCMEKAWCEVRTSIQNIEKESPALILVSTDGCINSFVEEDGFYKVGRDILELMREDGPDYIEENLQSWLKEISKEGSGDDISLGLLYRREGLDKTELNERPPPSEAP